MTERKYTDGYRKKRNADLPRLAALDILVQVREDGAYANLISRKTLDEYGLSGRDAAFALELAYGALRMRRFYGEVIEKSLTTPITKIQPLLLDVLHLGTHQLLSMRVPPHAALAATVDVARQVLSDGPSRLANAVLRRVSEKSRADWEELITADLPQIKAQALLHSHPDWIAEALFDSLQARELSQTLPQLLEANNKPAKVNLAAHPPLLNAQELLAELGGRGQENNLAATAVTLKSGVPGNVESVRAGLAAVQDAGSQLVTELFLNFPLSGPDERWLDMCAGPGGKATLMVGAAQERGAQVLLNELHHHRAKLVAKALRAFPTDNFRIRIGDAAQLPEDDRIGGPFDRVLLDAPCTGLGSLRRRPEARWTKTESDLPGLVKTQRELLQAASKLLRKGGIVAYITCSPHLEETTAQIDWATENLPLQKVAIADSDSLPAQSLRAQTLQLWPHLHQSDAMFLTILQKD